MAVLTRPTWRLPAQRRPRFKLTRATSGPELYRARPDGVMLREGVQARSDGDEEFVGILAGHAIKFGVPSVIEGEGPGPFWEIFEPRSFARTLSNRSNRSAIRMLYQHGHDFAVGDRPLGPFLDLREDASRGLFFRVGLLAGAIYISELLPAFRSGLMGSSIRFRAVKDEWEHSPSASDWNPDALPIRRVKEARLLEISVVTFAAHVSATAQLEGSGRSDAISLTEHFRRTPSTKSATSARPRAPQPAPSWRL